VLLMNGKTKISGIARVFAPSGVFAKSPAATVSQVTAKVSAASTPTTASHSTGVASGRKPSASATPMTTVSASAVRTKLPITWPVSTDARDTRIVRNRVMMPSFMSVVMLIAVDAPPPPIAITRMPGIT
jgi:hypothetical protein